MKQIDEITLMAYADGELDSTKADEVKRAIAADAALSAHVKRYRQSTDLIEETYGSIAKESCPPSISAVINIERVQAKKPWFQRHWLPLAASIAAVVVGVPIVSLQVWPPNDKDTISALNPGERSAPGPRASVPAASSQNRSSPTENSQIQGVVKIGAPAPDFAFTTMDGKEYRLSAFRGQPVMLWLFATWCRTCSAATVAVAENYDQLRRDGLQIIQLKLHKNLGRGGPTTKEFAEQFAGSRAFQSGWLWGDASKATSFAYNPNGYPDIYCLIDKNGILRDVALAPNVTMEKITNFTGTSGGLEGS